MGNEGTRRRNRNRRLRKQSQKQPNKRHAFAVSRNVFIIGIFISVMTFSIGKAVIDNIRLYNKGVEAKAYVYRYHRRDGLYEFKVLNERYTGRGLACNPGDSIQVVYLPKNPRINRHAEVMDKDWGIWLYRKLFE